VQVVDGLRTCTTACQPGGMRLLRSAPAVAVLALTASSLIGTSAPAEAATGLYKNCTALHHRYPHGVGKKGAHDKVRGHSKPVTTFTVNTKVYLAATKANRNLDADHDGIACEAH
jgi:hypothetical protein